MTVRAATIIKSAVSIIESDGWMQGALTENSGHGRHCVIGAVLLAARKYGLFQLKSAETELDDILRFLQDACGGEFVTKWNDEKGRTQKQVVKMMRKAAAYAEKSAAPAAGAWVYSGDGNLRFAA